MENVTANATHQDSFIDAAQRESFYRTLFNRRDVRAQFKPDPIPEEVLSRVLYAAHHAPSVGFMQPWNFLLIRSTTVKQKIHAAFAEAHAEAALMFPETRRETYRQLKLEGILESPLNICVTCDRSRTGPVVIGRTHLRIMDLYSSVCAVQNLWLAARAENLGVGWVSIIKQEAIRQTLGIPENIIPIAYLCLGYVSHFFREPELETADWLPRLPLADLLYFDQWGNQGIPEEESLIARIRQDEDLPQKMQAPA